MRIAALAFAAILTAAPAAAQHYDYNPFTDTWERGEPYRTPDPPAHHDPYWGMDGFYREQERATMQALEEQAHRENARQRGLAACSTIWNNPAAAEACRRSLGY